MSLYWGCQCKISFALVESAINESGSPGLRGAIFTLKLISVAFLAASTICFTEKPEADPKLKAVDFPPCSRYFKANNLISMDKFYIKDQDIVIFWKSYGENILY